MTTKKENGNGVFTRVELGYKKETPGTFVFTNEDHDCPIPSVYIRKTAFKGAKPPEAITLTVQVTAHD